MSSWLISQLVLLIKLSTYPPQWISFSISPINTWYGDILISIHTQNIGLMFPTLTISVFITKMISISLLGTSFTNEDLITILHQLPTHEEVTHEEVEKILNDYNSGDWYGHEWRNDTTSNILYAPYLCPSIFHDCIYFVVVYLNNILIFNKKWEVLLLY